MAYSSTPQISSSYQDGNFDIVTQSTQPRILVIGTATEGSTSDFWRVGSVSAAVKEFKNTGTLTKTMYEVAVQGADNIFLRRLPTGTPATLSGIGSNTPNDGATVTTILEDDEAGSRYAIWFSSSTGRLAIYDTVEEEWIYDTEEELAIDTGLISVSGTITVGEGVNIGSQSSPVAMEDCESLHPGVLDYTAGTDGSSPSLMELYEALNEVYEELDWQHIDFVVPARATVNAPNLVALAPADITDRNLSALTDYPTADSVQDVLGYMYKEEYHGQWYYWWDTDNDGVAEIYPSGVGSASASTSIDGSALTSSDFVEVNFAYQLAEFCRKASTTWHACIGFIGAEAPDGYDKSSLAEWIGQLPSYTELSDGSLVVSSSADNGTGLLGNKFMAGRKNFRGSVKDGGFIQTDTGEIGGTEETDENDHVVDIGKHIIVAPLWAVHVNQYVSPTSSTGRPAPYLGNTATTVAGKYATLSEKEEANGLNGLVKGIRLDGLKIPGRLLNALISVRYVVLRSEPSVGVILSGSKTAARPDSDWTKISTIRSVNRELQGLRAILVRYLGKEFSPAILQAIKTSAEGFLNNEANLGFNNGSKFNLFYTTAQRRLGQLKAKLKMVPPFAIETIDVEISVADDESSL